VVVRVGRINVCLELKYDNTLQVN